MKLSGSLIIVDHLNIAHSIEIKCLSLLFYYRCVVRPLSKVNKYISKVVSVFQKCHSFLGRTPRHCTSFAPLMQEYLAKVIANI